MRNRTLIIIYLLGLGILLPIWEFSGQSHTGIRILVSSPSLVLGFISQNLEMLSFAMWITFVEAFIGLCIATGACIVLVILVFMVPSLLSLLLPLMITSQVIPLIVLSPFFVIALGIGISSKIALTAVLAFFPTFIGFAQGYRLISPDVHNLLDILEAPRRFRVFRAYIPLALPSGLAGLKISATLSVIGAIVAEMNGAEVGLGRNLFLSTIRLQPELMVASVIGAAILGILMYGIVWGAEQRLGHWYIQPAKGLHDET